MLLNGTVVNTPYDNPADYQPDWRHRVAVASVEARQTLDIDPEDLETINEQVRYMRYVRDNVKDGTHRLPSKYRDHKIVSDWFFEDGQTKQVVEALLLTEYRYKDISDYMGVPSRLIKLYERLFFNVRGADGESCPKLVLKSRLVSEDTGDSKNKNKPKLKQIAVDFGPELLLAKLGCRPSLEVEDHVRHIGALASGAYNLSLNRIVSGEMADQDIIGLYRARNDSVKNAQEYQLGIARHAALSATAVTGTAAFTFIRDLAPEVIDVLSLDSEQLELQQAAIDAKLAVEKSIDDVKV